MLTAASDAHGQNTEEPLRQAGLFGSTRSTTGNRDRLNLLFDASEARQSELPPEAGFRVARGDLQSGGYSSILTSTADYLRTRRRTQLAGTLLTSFKYYPHLDRVVPVSHSAGLDLTVRLPKQSTLDLNSTAAYAPAYLYQLFPRAAAPEAAEAIPADPDYRIDQSDSYSYATHVTLGLGAPRKTRVTAIGEYRRTEFHKEIVPRSNLETSFGDLRLSRGLSRNSTIKVEYEYRTGTYSYNGVTNQHQLTIGGEYRYALSQTRHAAFYFNLSPALVEVPESSVVASLRARFADSDAAPETAVDTRLYRLQGDGRIEFDLAKSWRAIATYRRGVEYLAVLSEPVLSDAARVEVGGLVSRRIDVSAVGGHAVGKSALARETQNLKTDTAQVRVRFALTRSLALYSQYLYYDYDLRGQSRLAPSLPSAFKQHEVRLGFMLFTRPIDTKGKGSTRWPERTRPTKS